MRIKETQNLTVTLLIGQEAFNSQLINHCRARAWYSIFSSLKICYTKMSMRIMNTRILMMLSLQTGGHLFQNKLKAKA